MRGYAVGANFVDHALDGSQRRCARRRLVAIEVAIGHGIRRQVDVGQQRAVAALVVGVRGRDAQRAKRAAVEGAVEGDDRRPAGRPARQLERALDGLGAGVAEEDGVERVGQRAGQHLRQPRNRLVVAHALHQVEQSVGLGVDGGSDGGVPMAEHGDRDAGGEIEVGLAVRVVEAMALAVVPVALEVAGEDRRQVFTADLDGVELRDSPHGHG